jgi:hypothetical protein
VELQLLTAARVEVLQSEEAPILNSGIVGTQSKVGFMVPKVPLDERSGFFIAMELKEKKRRASAYATWNG